MQWTTEYSVNVPEFDAQHQRWFTLINDLHAAMVSGSGKDALGKILTGLIDYTKTHFAAEEQLLTAKGYPSLARHKQMHQALIAKILDFQTQFRAGKLGLSISLLQVLRQWLSEHILGADRLYGQFLTKKQVA